MPQRRSSVSPRPASARQGRFLDYWIANGGLARNSYPIGPEDKAMLEDGKGHTFQYFACG
jgi:hypothetical protein